MDLTSDDVREVRFGTTRFRAGYDMGEVDAFLDRVEAAIGEYGAETQRLKDESGALRSQVQQLQGRLEAANQELERAQQAALSASPAPTEHDTVIVDESSGAVVVAESDVETTAENPVVSPSVGGAALADLRRIRDDLRSMLNEQLQQVDRIDLPADGSVPGDGQSHG